MSYRYAQRTKVNVNTTRGQIETLLKKRGASALIVGENQEYAQLVFEMHDWRLKFLMPLAKKSRSMSEKQAAAETRRRWRALLLVLKAKLEAVDSGIVEFQTEFLAHIMTNANQTVGDQIIPTLPALVSGGKMPPLLGPGQEVA